MANRYAREEGEFFALVVCISIILVFTILPLFFAGTTVVCEDLEPLKNNSEAVNVTKLG